jgi:hypothetical protein
LLQALAILPVNGDIGVEIEAVQMGVPGSTRGQAQVEAIEDRRRRDVSKMLADPGGGHAAMLSVASSTTRSYSPRW